jgi:hypothetical protein
VNLNIRMPFTSMTESFHHPSWRFDNPITGVIDRMADLLLDCRDPCIVEPKQRCRQRCG